MKELNMIKLYCYICEKYNENLCWNVQRFSRNGNNGYITDVEIITIYIYCSCYEEKYQIKHMYKHIKNYWLSWFPKLPSYQCFTKRLNRLKDALSHLMQLQMQDFSLPNDTLEVFLGDSFPIMTCSHKRKAKVALDLVSKGFCATKNLHYFGVKLHSIGLKRDKTIPFPQFLDISPASTHDLTALKDILQQSKQKIFVFDKAYISKEVEEEINKNKSVLLTPLKDKKGLPELLKQIDQAAKDLFNTAVSVVRQPIESFFNYINQLTQIQDASKVRSKDGLMVHIFGKLVSVLWKMSL